MISSTAKKNSLIIARSVLTILPRRFHVARVTSRTTTATDDDADADKDLGEKKICVGRTVTNDGAEEDDDRRDIPINPAQFLLEQPLKLYRDCLRLADYVAHKQEVKRALMREEVRSVWRKNQFLIDESEIREKREHAIRGLSNSMMHFATEGAKKAGRSALVNDLDDDGTTKEV